MEMQVSLSGQEDSFFFTLLCAEAEHSFSSAQLAVLQEINPLNCLIQTEGLSCPHYSVDIITDFEMVIGSY